MSSESHIKCRKSLTSAQKVTRSAAKPFFETKSIKVSKKSPNLETKSLSWEHWLALQDDGRMEFNSLIISNL